MEGIVEMTITDMVAAVVRREMENKAHLIAEAVKAKMTDEVITALASRAIDKAISDIKHRP